MNKDTLKNEIRNKLQKFIDQTKIYKYVIVNNQNNYSIQLTNKYTKDILLINIINNTISLSLDNECKHIPNLIKCSIDNKGIELFNLWLKQILKTF